MPATATPNGPLTVDVQGVLIRITCFTRSDWSMTWDVSITDAANQRRIIPTWEIQDLAEAKGVDQETAARLFANAAWHCVKDGTRTADRIRAEARRNIV